MKINVSFPDVSPTQVKVVVKLLGMLVDGSVVVVENVINHLSDKEKSTRLPRLHIIY